MKRRVHDYFHTLGHMPLETEVTDRQGMPIVFHEAYEQLTRKIRATHEAGNKLMFIGNGGSAGIASHMAIDYSKNGGIRSLAFNDGAALTCLANDLGYENVFSKQMELHAQPGDLLIAISSSGKSPNILNACKAAAERGCSILTFSGFTEENLLRRCGDLNFYVGASEYGFVEITHLALIHAILDLAMGWGVVEGEDQEEASQKKPLRHVA